MNSLIEFFAIGHTYPLSNMLKQLRFFSPVFSNDMSKARVVTSFQYILSPEFDRDSASFLNFLTKPEKWKGLYGTGGCNVNCKIIQHP